MSEPGTPETTPAVQREAENNVDSITVAWQDLTLVLPATVDDWDPDIVEAFENGKAITAIRSLLGSDAYDKFKIEFRKIHGRKFLIRDANQFGELLAETYGFENRGNS